MKFSSKVLLGVLAAAVANSASVDAVCTPPAGIGSADTDEFPANFAERKLEKTGYTYLFQPIAQELFKYIGENFGQLAPPGVRAAQIISMAWYNCCSKHDENALDTFGAKNNEICQPTTGTEAEKVQLKKAHEQIATTLTIAKLAIELFPELEWQIRQIMEVDLEIPLDAPEEPEPAGTPRKTAETIVKELIPFVKNDGWNAEGDQDRKYNKIPYQDFKFTDPETQETRLPYDYKLEESVLTGPSSTKTYLRRLAQKERLDKKQEKPIKETDEFSLWKPQRSSNGKGQICMKQHLTPHIGATGRLYGLEQSEYEWKSSPVPELGFQDATTTYQAVQALVVDDEAKMLAQMFDDPTILLKASEFNFGANGMGEILEEIPMLDVASGFMVVATTVYDACLLAYRDKVLFNLARPEQIVQEKLAEKTIYTYAGPDEGLKNILGREFQPFIRAKPTAEYPSAHSAMYKAAADALEILTGTDALEKLEITFPPGSSTIQPGTNPKAAETITFTSFSQIAEKAGWTRVAAGVNYPEAVTAGQEVVSEIAQKIYERATKLLNGNDEGKLASFTDRKITLKTNVALQEK